MKRLTWIVVCLFYFSTLVWAAPNTKVNNLVVEGVPTFVDNSIDGFGVKDNTIRSESIIWTSPTYPSVDCTVTSAGGHVGHPLDNSYKLSNPVIDVRTKGAVCDGVTDDSSAINAAIVAAGRKPVILPVGSCVVKSPIVLKEGTRLFGSSRIDVNTLAVSGTYIKHNSATLDNVFTVGEPDTGNYTYDIEVAHLGVMGDSNTNAIFNLHKVGMSYFHNLTLAYGAYGIYIDYGMLNVYRDVYIRNQTNSCVTIGTTAATTKETFRDVSLGYAPWGLVLTTSASHITLESTTIQSMTVGGINVYWTAANSSLYVDKLHTEAINDNIIRWGMDGTWASVSGNLVLKSSQIEGGNNPAGGNAIVLHGLRNVVLDGNHFSMFDNVVYVDLNTPIYLYGNDVASNNRTLSDTTTLSYVYGIYSPDPTEGDMIRASKLAIGAYGKETTNIQWGASAASDNSALLHGLAVTPTAMICTTSVDNEVCSITSIGAQYFTVRIRKTDGAEGTYQTIYWIALK